MKSIRTLLPILLVAALVAAACTGSRPRYKRVLDEAERLMTACPDSSLILLNRYKDEKGQWPLKERMRFDLLRTNAMNKSDSVFTSDSIAREVSDYYTHHGTPNERMLAHYLLGRAYSDMGEAPLAAKCFLDAISLADTTRRDCDYRQLYTVYFQLSNEFYRQMLFREQLSAIDKAVYYANLVQDSLTAVICYQYKSFAYDKLSCYDSVVYVTERASDAFLRLGDVENSSRTLAAGLRSLLKLGDLERAAAVINTYESKSGFFNESDDIAPGREIYYSMKGDYYLARHQPDSAEYYFRKELKDGKDLNNQNAATRGLALVYEMKHNPDSVAVYSLRSYTLNDSVYSGMATEKVKQVQALYNYQRNEHLAMEEKARAESKERMLQLLFALFVLAGAITYIMVSRIIRNRHQEREQLKKSLSILEQAKRDVARLKTHEAEYQDLISEKEEIISRQLKMLNDNNQGYKSIQERGLKESEEYISLMHAATLGLEISNDEFVKAESLIKLYFPEFYTFIKNNDHVLNNVEYRTCLLSRLYFKPKEIANMLGISLPYVSRIRKNLLIKLFATQGKAKDFDSKICEIN